MHKLFSTLTLLLVISAQLFAQKDPTHYYVEIRTDKGNALLKLYNETPKHRDNYRRLVKEGYYDSLMFHRVIEHFMIQGGDPGSRYAIGGQPLGSGGPDYRVPAEFVDSLIHKKGALAAARSDNPEKESSGSQFYLVQGRVFSEAGLDSLEEFRLKKKMTPLQRETYSTIGGVPHLDGNYTVFGELLDGIAVVDSIATVETDDRDRPRKDERMFLRLLTRSEALQVEHGPNWVEPKQGLFKQIFGKKPSEDYTIKDDTDPVAPKQGLFKRIFGKKTSEDHNTNE